MFVEEVVEAKVEAVGAEVGEVLAGKAMVAVVGSCAEVGELAVQWAAELLLEPAVALWVACPVSVASAGSLTSLGFSVPLSSSPSVLSALSVATTIGRNVNQHPLLPVFLNQTLFFILDPNTKSPNSTTVRSNFGSQRCPTNITGT